ncbi:MAG TPA: hypothetical protein VNQ77_05665 [Frankiaceae bacterium]|nr:hypothetical protein [Frankiaceae bacterium]
MDDTVEVPQPAPRPRRLRATGLVAAGLVGGLVLAGLGVASAQSGDPSPAPDRSPKAERLHRGPRGPFGHHRGGMKLGKGVLHGEYVTRAPEGGYRTMATQNGEATAVSASSITVRSEDGFTRTYAIDDDTLVRGAFGDGADVKAGDEVHVVAVVEGGTARAFSIGNITEIERAHERLRRDHRPPVPSESAG